MFNRQSIYTQSKTSMHENQKIQPLDCGTLRLIIGPMYAGKTSKLIETYTNAMSNNLNNRHTVKLTNSFNRHTVKLTILSTNILSN